MYSYFFLLSGQNVGLGNGELRSLIRCYQPEARMKNLGNRLVLVDKVDVEKITERATCIKAAGRLLHISDTDRIIGFELNGMIRNCKRFACDLVNLSKKSVGREVLSDLGRYVKERAPWMNVSLEDPDVTVLLIKTETESTVGLVHKRLKRKSESARSRPYFHPVALDPQLCRIMINMAMVKEYDTILDPFCGTGSIMLEANSMKINAVGCDLSEKMCRGALANLKSRSDDGFMVNCDALSLPFRMDAVNAVVTDLPYGRAASTLKRGPKELLEEFLDVIRGMKDKRCCVMCRKGDEQEFPNIVEQYDIYEHRSLTRKLMVICS